MIELNKIQRNNFKKLINLILEKQHSVKNIFEEYLGEEIEYTLFNFNTFIQKYLNTTNIIRRDPCSILSIEQLTKDIKTNPIIINKFYSTLIIHYPNITITNEYDESHIITDVYIRIKIDLLGRLIGSFTLYRGSCTSDEFKSGYLHSHSTKDYDIEVKYDDVFDKFKECCTGSGPIRHTICSLNNKYDEDLYKLFIVELRKWLETESIQGGTYIRMSEINKVKIKDTFEVGNLDRIYYKELKTETYNYILNNFIIYLLKNMNFVFNKSSEGYSLSIIDRQMYLEVGKLFESFIKYYIQQPEYKNNIEESNDILEKMTMKAIIRDGKLYYYEKSSNSDITDNKLQSYINNPVYLFTFKGNDIRLKITKDIKNNKKIKPMRLVNCDTLKLILTRILEIANINYESDKNKISTKYKII